MAKKIGRNAPCPCGSGLKYKSCCMKKDEVTVMKTIENQKYYSGVNKWDAVEDYFSTHSTVDIFNFIIGLQLSPANHGKNVRIEDLARLAIRYAHSGGKPIEPYELTKILDRDFGSNHMEDLPCNMFSEYVAFYGGAYTVFPGISCQSIEILNDLLFAVFKSKNSIPEITSAEISTGVQYMLFLGDSLAKMAGVEGNCKGIEDEHSCFDYSLCGKDFSIPVEEIKRGFSQNKTVLNIIDSFVLDLSDPGILLADPDHSPLLSRPIVEFEGRYYFLLISNQANAINSFILKKVISCKCESDIAHSMHKHIWDGIRYGCTLMDWPLTSYELPHNTAPYIEEVVAQFDVNWITYICYVHDLGDNFKDAINCGHFIYNVDDHIHRAVGFLKSNADTKNYHVLTLLLYSSSGEMIMLPHNGGEQEDYRLAFSAYDFIQLTKSEHWTRLSLLRFAQMVKRHEGCFGATLNLLDIYSLYKSKQESFYLSDTVKYSSIIIPPDDGMQLIFDAKIKRNFRTVDFIKDGGLVSMSVVSALEDMPIFKPDIDSGEYYVVTTAYVPAIWIHCAQVKGKYNHEYDMADLFGMAIAFWMTKLSPALSVFVDDTFTTPIIIELIFDENVLDEKRHDGDFSCEPVRGAFDFSWDDGILSLKVNRKAMSLMSGGTNEGERYLMSELIVQLLNLDEGTISQALNDCMPLNSAKMILLSDTEKNELLDPRYLRRPLYISSAIDQIILEQLPEFMAEKSLDIEDRIDLKEEKIVFLNNIVNVLLEKLQSEVSKYNKTYLLKHIVDINESLIWDREHDGILVPAKLLCLADTPEKRESYHEREKVLTDSSLAARCLAEYVVSQNTSSGILMPGWAEIEYMMALMQSVITFGSQSDSLYYGLADVQIEKLGSGRYAINDDVFQDKMEEFSKAYIEEDINRHIASFPGRLQIKPTNNQLKSDKNYNIHPVTADEVNEAFTNDWGISFADIDSFCYGCFCLCLNQKTSVLDIDEKSLISGLIAIQPNLTTEKIQICIKHFCLSPRPSYLTAPAGYNNYEVFPWVYNRELSYVRRFLLRYKIEDKKCRYILGPRSAMSSLRQLSTLLVDGRLKDDTTYLKALRSKFNDIKGKEFNEEVREFLKKESTLKVWDWEVKIDIDGNLQADRNYGDIDVLAYDSDKKMLFSIECKNTEKARNVKEMKTELDKYFGPADKGKKGYIQKHIERHEWLVNNYEKVKDMIGEQDDFVIRSIIMTSEVIPLAYISKIKPSLPILAFSQLKYEGVSVLLNR